MQQHIDGSSKLKDLVARMTLKNSYWGYLFSRIRRVPDNNVPSIMGVCPESDGTVSLKFRPNMVMNTDEDNLKLILEHEGMHLLNKHIPRLIRIIADEFDDKRKYIKSRIWNSAADCCVNSQIKNFPKSLKINGEDWPAEFPEKYKLPKGHACEFYYNKLFKDVKITNIKIPGVGSGDSSGKDKDENGDDKSIGDHSKWQNGTEEALDSHTLARRIENFTQDIARQALKNFNRNRGNLPGGLLELIEDLLQPPKAPYYQIIAKLVKATRLTKFKRCSTRVNRKRTYAFVLDEFDIPQISPFPGRKRDYTFNIGVLIDTSGSQSKEDIIDALSGVKSLIESDKHCKVTVIENDTQVQKEYDIKKLSDIQMKVKGRGGTTLLPGLERFRETQVDVVLGFTDGYCENLNEVNRRKLPKKLIWAVRKDHGTVETINRTGFIVRI